MLTKSQARAFFLIGTAVTTAVFVGLTVDTFRRIPAQTNSADLTEQVARGKALWDRNNCMGCHTILGEGAYYAPELTKVYDAARAGLHPRHAARSRGHVSGAAQDGEIPLHARADRRPGGVLPVDRQDGPERLSAEARPDAGRGARRGGGLVATVGDRPQIFNQMCIACHALGGQGGVVGPGARRRGVAARRRLHRAAGSRIRSR